jgi:hypothetical protein
MLCYAEGVCESTIASLFFTYKAAMSMLAKSFNAILMQSYGSVGLWLICKAFTPLSLLRMDVSRGTRQRRNKDEALGVLLLDALEIEDCAGRFACGLLCL